MYDLWGCPQSEAISDGALTVDGDQITFYEVNCEVTDRTVSGEKTKFSLSCESEGSAYYSSIALQRLPNANLLVTSDNGENSEYEFCGPNAQTSANICSLTGATFQDEMGENADVTKIEECFGWFDRDNQTASEGCATFEERSLEIKNSKSDVRVVGSRLYHMRYRNENVVFAEHVQFGSPWLVNSVNPEFDSDLDWIAMPKEAVDQMIGDEDYFDFTDYGASDGVSGRFSLKQCGAM